MYLFYVLAILEKATSITYWNVYVLNPRLNIFQRDGPWRTEHLRKPSVLGPRCSPTHVGEHIGPSTLCLQR